MRALSELDLRYSYHKGQNDIANEFYLPCMQRATSYDRAVGFFNSTIYMIAWPSLKDFVKRQGKMRVICSPVLSAEDMEALGEGYEGRLKEQNRIRLTEEINRMLEDPFLQKPTRVLASLVAMGLLQFRIAFVHSDSDSRHRRLFHDKLGIFYDDHDNAVAFKGSMNETWAGLSSDGNLESVDVFVTWYGGRDEARVRDEIRYFEALWNNEYPTVSVDKFPETANIKLINAADPTKWSEWVDEICSEMDALTSLSADRRPGGRTPLPHQVNALQEWFKRGRRGILEHATGSGKTFTALCAIRDSINKKETPVVLVPSQLLLQQWTREIRETFKDLDIQMLLCGAGETRWRDNSLLGPWTAKSDKPRIVVATMQTAARKDFRDAIRQGEHLFLVADEVHRLGSSEHRKILSLESGPRLGLSATPRRAGDPEGTDAIFTYFEGVVPPPFTLQDAIRANRLTRYMYYVHPVSLSEEEQDEWDSITKRIRRLYAQEKSSQGENITLSNHIKRLLIERARITKAAKEKVRLADEVLRRYYEHGQRWIVYCDSQPQLYAVLGELRKHDFDALEYHSSMPGDRGQTLRYFEANGGILVSIRCLDEGVDIPSVSHALILASSKNPREFIQRRGRVLRKSDNKALAFLHDAIVVPRRIEADFPGTAIVEGEIARAIKFGQGAENPSSIADLRRIALRFGLDHETLVEEGVEEDE